MALRELSSERECRPDVGFFEIRKVLKQLFHSATGCHGLNHHPDSHPHTSDAWFSSHHFRINRDALNSLHKHMVSQKYVSQSRFPG